jgi:hypothetical protein
MPEQHVERVETNEESQVVDLALARSIAQLNEVLSGLADKGLPSTSDVQEFNRRVEAVSERLAAIEMRRTTRVAYEDVREAVVSFFSHGHAENFMRPMVNDALSTTVISEAIEPVNLMYRFIRLVDWNNTTGRTISAGLLNNPHARRTIWEALISGDDSGDDFTEYMERRQREIATLIDTRTSAIDRHIAEFSRRILTVEDRVNGFTSSVRDIVNDQYEAELGEEMARSILGSSAFRETVLAIVRGETFPTTEAAAELPSIPVEPYSVEALVAASEAPPSPVSTRHRRSTTASDQPDF